MVEIERQTRHSTSKNADKRRDITSRVQSEITQNPCSIMFVWHAGIRKENPYRKVTFFFLSLLFMKSYPTLFIVPRSLSRSAYRAALRSFEKVCDYFHATTEPRELGVNTVVFHVLLCRSLSPTSSAVHNDKGEVNYESR